MTTTKNLHSTFGTPPVGTATGNERWATITEDDGTLTVTAYHGWGITDEVHLSGDTAVSLYPNIARALISA